MYSEDEFLTLSSLRHFCYCKHLWGLTQLENYWSDNYHTTNGHLAHQKTDNPFIEDKRRDILIVRSLHTSSKRLGLQGVLDTVEFIKNDNGISLAKHSGKWIPHVVEYKESKTDQGIEDAMQTVAQVICLEETFHCTINYCYIYYRKTNQKIKIIIDNNLRTQVQQFSDTMHSYYDNHTIERPHYSKKCKGCALIDICNPKWPHNVSQYITKQLTETNSPLL
jgi:CRISPR-associated protein Cas4